LTLNRPKNKEDKLLSSQEIKFDEFLAAKTFCSSGTCPNLAEITLTGSEYVDEFAAYQPQWSEGFKIPEKTDLDTSVTLKGHSADPIIPNTESPFDELDENLTNDEKIKILIDYIQGGSKIQFAQELAFKLNFLNEVVNEDPEDGSISIDSMRNFINFLQNTTNLKCPNVALTPSNEIHAQWRTAPNRHLALVFLQTGETRFVIFSPNSKDPEMIDRISGLTSVDSLLETIKPHKVLEWASK
jgi:hypothetical protein